NRWDFDDGSSEWMDRFRISANAVYPFLHSGEVAFLRFAPADEKAPDAVKGELNWLLWLRERGFPANRPLRAKGGQLVAEADTPWGRYVAAAFAGVPGRPLDDTGLTPDIAAAWGASLGRLHQLSAQCPAMARPDHDAALVWSGREMAALGDREAVDEAHRLRDRLSALPREHYGLVHYDFETDNVFYDPATGIHAIDFDDCMYHWYALDVEQALYSLPPGAGDAIERAFLTGYRAQYPLPDDALALRPLMRRFADLYGYARARRAAVEAWDCEPEWMAGLRGYFDTLLKQRASAFGAPLP
ncbi:MAG: phosphotransferase, partial [Clostridiales bacterium]|nr:phosphotransferase [Clostridiales bacterium]